MAVAALGWVWTLGVAAVTAATLLLYVLGWRRLRAMGSSLAQPARLAASVAGTLLIAGALAGPLALWSQESYLARMGQKVAICLLGAPLWWLGAPFHSAAPALPAPARRTLAAWLVRPHRLSPMLASLTSPAVVWFLYLSAFLLWHDPTLTDWSMERAGRQRLMLLALLAAALLFWQQITLMGPRRYTRATLPARFAMLVAVEIANVIAGITIAFKSAPLYAYYAKIAASPYADGSGFSQQTLGGALTWVFGSLVYIASIVLVANEVFRREGANHPLPPVGWDAEERFIAPGLEDRLREVGWERHDWQR